MVKLSTWFLTFFLLFCSQGCSLFAKQKSLFVEKKRRVARSVNDIKCEVGEELKRLLLASSSLVSSTTNCRSCRKPSEDFKSKFEVVCKAYVGGLNEFGKNFGLLGGGKNKFDEKINFSVGFQQLCDALIRLVSVDGIPLCVEKIDELVNGFDGSFFARASREILENYLLSLSSLCRKLEAACHELRVLSGDRVALGN